MNRSILLYYILLFIITLLFVFDPSNRLMLLFAGWITMIVFCLRDLNGRIALLAFIVAVFSFLMTRLIIPVFYSNVYISDSLGNTMSFRPDTYDFMAKAIFLSLICAFSGFNSVHQKKELSFEFNPSSNYVSRLRKVSRTLMVFSSLFYAAILLEEAFYMWQNGYMDLYLSYESKFPPLFKRFSLLYHLSFFIFLSTLPSKRQAKPYIVYYCLLSVLPLLSGQRAGFILDILVIVVYFFIRNRQLGGEKWIGTKGKFLLLLFVPLVCALMFIVLLLRGENSTDGYSLGNMIVNFFFQQGSSMQVLGLTYEVKGTLPPNKFYSFGTIIDNFNNNIIYHLLGIAESYRSQTVEFAINGHSLANYLTYQYQTQRFLAGGGMGSCYMAEVWADWGMVGLGLWSFVYGWVLSHITIWSQKNVWMFAISFYMMRAIVFAPRSSAISFISDFMSPTFLLAMIVMHFYSNWKS